MISKRKCEPAHYMLKIESFSLLSEAKTSIIQSDVFEASGRKWYKRLDLHPNGNKEANAGDHICLYLVICETESLSEGWEVCVDVNFYLYDHITSCYATNFQGVDGNRIRFSEKMMKWGYDKLISMESFKDSKNGYLWNDSCVFGAEVFNVPASYTQKDRCLSLVKPPATMNNYIWTIDNFSAVSDERIYSEVFKVGKVKWKLSLHPKGIGTGDGTHLSIFLWVHDSDSLPAGWRFYTKFKLRLKNQCSCLDKELESDRWFHDESPNVGCGQFMLLGTPTNPENGFMLNDILIVEAEFSIVGTLKDFI